LRHLGQGQLALQRSCSGGKGGHARRERIGNTERIEAAELLADRAPQRQVAGMKPRDVLVCFVGGLELSDNLLEAHRRGVDDARPSGQSARIHQRACEKAYLAAGDEIRAA
jgi:hypothetical protein